MIELEIPEFDGMEKRLHELPQEMARGVAQTALRRAAEFLRDKVIANINALFTRRSGDMLRAVQIKETVEPGRRGGSIVRAFVFTAPHASKAPHWFFWTRGFQHVGKSRKLSRALRHQARAAKRAGEDVRGAKRGIGKFMQRDAWTPAFEENARQALAIIVAEMRSGFDAAVNQVRAKFPGKKAA